MSLTPEQVRDNLEGEHITVFLTNGVKLSGTGTNLNNPESMVLTSLTTGTNQTIYKHAIATIGPFNPDKPERVPHSHLKTRPHRN